MVWTGSLPVNAPDKPATDAPTGDPAAGVPHYDVHQLTGSDGRATIALEGQVYTLRITKAGKLILTK